MVVKSLKSLNKLFTKKLDKKYYYVVIGKDENGKYWSAYVWYMGNGEWFQDVAGEVRLYPINSKYDYYDCDMGLFKAELDAFPVYKNWIPLPSYDLEFYHYGDEKEMKKACQRMIELGMYRII